jgi:hypothetical protein
MLVTTTASGRAMSQSSITSPARRAPISATITSVVGVAPNSVIGNPISLLKDAGLAHVRNRVASTAVARSFVEVLPLAPVMPITNAPGNRRRSSAPSARSARPVSATSIPGPSTGRSTIAPTAPRSNASPAKE